MNQTIILSNRKLKRKGKKKVLTNKFSENLSMAIATPYDKTSVVKRVGGKVKYRKETKTYSLNIIEENVWSRSFSKVIAKANNRPWLFFLHGNNQTPEENLKKARRIQDLYNVNMVVFSWPSKSYNFKVLKIGKKLFSARNSHPIILAGTGIAVYVDEKKSQYAEAKKMAEKTAANLQLKTGFSLVQQYLFDPLKNQNSNVKINLLVHSLGNYLIQQSQPSLSAEFQTPIFDRGVFHQGDCSSNGHEFLSHLGIVNPNNVHVVQNINDAALAASGAINSGFDDIRSRLGNDVDLERIGDFKYMDYSGRVGISHQIAWGDNIDEDVIADFQFIFS